MKKIIVLIALVITPAISFGQSIFDKLENIDEVSSVVLTQDAFQLLSKFDSDSKSEEMEVFRMIQNLKVFKLFTTKDAATIKVMKGMVNSHIKSEKLIQLMRIKDKDANVKIYVKSGKNKDFVNEVLMIVNGVSSQSNGYADSMIMSLTGKIDVNKLSELANKFSKNNKVNVKIK